MNRAVVTLVIIKRCLRFYFFLDKNSRTKLTDAHIYTIQANPVNPYEHKHRTWARSVCVLRKMEWKRWCWSNKFSWRRLRFMSIQCHKLSVVKMWRWCFADYAFNGIRRVCKSYLGIVRCSPNTGPNDDRILWKSKSADRIFQLAEWPTIPHSSHTLLLSMMMMMIQFNFV